MKIGIGLTFRNRIETTAFTVGKICEFLPFYNKIAIVDDASIGDVRLCSAFRFDENVGVSVAKNKCLSILDDCDYLFLFDNDTYPTQKGWHLPYIESGLNHACFTFDRKIIDVKPNYIEFEKPNGCMLFFTRKAIQTVGGWDTDFKGFGYEHVNLSDRIFNAGLTPARYIDVHNSSMYFKLADVPSTFSQEERIRTIPINQKLYKERYLSKEFKPYK